MDLTIHNAHVFYKLTKKGQSSFGYLSTVTKYLHENHSQKDGIHFVPDEFSGGTRILG